MRTLLFSFMVAAYAATLVGFATPASADRDDHRMKHAKCPPGYHWKGAHRARNGTWVPAGCVPKHHPR